ncbi:MAG: hypothetical protein Fur0025_45210 [Oscillatoriaceae cyanobacterium]
MPVKRLSHGFIRTATPPALLSAVPFPTNSSTVIISPYFYEISFRDNTEKNYSGLPDVQFSFNPVAFYILGDIEAMIYFQPYGSVSCPYQSQK